YCPPFWILFPQKLNTILEGNYLLLLRSPKFYVTKILLELNVPATFFVPTGLIPQDLVDFYKELDQGDLIAIEDHSLYHRKMFSGPKLIGFYSSNEESMALDHMKLQNGMPVLESTSELAGPLFKIDQRINDFSLENSMKVDWTDKTAIFNQIVEPLISLGFAKLKRGGIYLSGTYETDEEFKMRIHNLLESGKANFVNIFGRSPTAYCYPFYQHTTFLEKSLLNLGYQLQFGGGNIFWYGKTALVFSFSIDRITKRPINFYNDFEMPTVTRASLWARSKDLGMAVDIAKKLPIFNLL
ncbi:MAG: hypothetical protein WAT12_07230, partial [Candidatus Nitrotoga sp.]